MRILNLELTAVFFLSFVVPFLPPPLFAREDSSPAPAPTAAVWDLANLTKATLSDDDLAAITQHIRVKVFNIMPGYRWLERGRIGEILDEQKFQASGCTDQSCVVEMGQLLGARKMVAGSISRVGDTYNMALNVIDIETGLVDKSVSETCPGCKDGQLFSLAENTVRSLAGKRSSRDFAPPTVPKAVKPHPVVIHKKRLNLDIKTNGAGLRYFPDDRTAVELRGYMIERPADDLRAVPEKKMLFLGARIYGYGAHPNRPLQPYLCLEMDIVPYVKSAAGKSDGIAAGGFVGIECFLGRGVSAQADLGAVYTKLVNKETKNGSEGLKYLLNFGVNIYFGE